MRAFVVWGTVLRLSTRRSQRSDWRLSRAWREIYPLFFNLQEIIMSDDKVPYGKDAQIFTFGVHGTNNGPDNVRNVTQRISAQLDHTTNGANLYDAGFSWQHRSGTTNQASDREAASRSLSQHVLGAIDVALHEGKLDRNKALTVNLVGFSHGGNVAIQAADDIAEGLKARSITSAIHLTTLSTPAYTTGAESPGVAGNAVEGKGVPFSHTHFSVAGDGVIRGAMGNSHYDQGRTRNYDLPSVSDFDGIANHGAPQDSVPHMVDIATTMRTRFNGLAPAQKHSDVGSDTVVASAITTPQTNGANSPDFKNNPTVQQIYAALDRNGDNQNPSLVAGLAGAAAGLSKVQDVALTPQSAFALDRDKSDPAANRVQVSMDVASKPFDEVWQKASVALQQTQTPAVVAQAQDQDLTQKQNARAM